VARALHWGIALLIIGQISFGFLLDTLAPRNTPSRSVVINLHKSFGLVLLVLIVLRVAWRLKHRPPRWPAVMSLAEQTAATWGHRALYAVMLALPLSGYVASNFSKHGIKLFNVVLLPPWGPDIPTVYRFFNGMHVLLAFALTALVIGHVVAALRHRFKRDGVFQRMGK
jgi:cytochrome b561